MNKYEVVVGVEIHLELNTKTKMFSQSLVTFGQTPNTHANEVDLGYPGSLPSVNENAVWKGISLAKYFGMKINNPLIFDRKNYFYPDLPKGYQITQFYKPLGEKGQVFLESGKRIEILDIHLEEDTAKSMHEGKNTLLDFNRAGNPLIEIVTSPNFSSGKEVGEYVELIRFMALALNISDAKMENGSLRIDVNVSLKKIGEDVLGTKVEIKNLNSISNVIKSIENEIALQQKTLDEGQEVINCTKRFDEATGQNVLMRKKTSQVDYRFFPDPNILPIYLDQKEIEAVSIPEFPWEKRKRYELNVIDNEFIKQLILDFDKSSWFDALKYHNLNESAKIFFSQIVPLAKSQNTEFKNLKISPDLFDKVMTLLEQNKIGRNHLKDIFTALLSESDLEKVIKNLNIQINDNEEELKQIVLSVIEKNKEFIEKNKTYPERVFKFVVGQCMKETKGQASPQILSKIVKSIL